MTDLEIQDLNEDYKKFIEFYFEIKSLVAAAEREDIQQRISISSVAELRAAFDHIMRVHNVMYGVVSEEIILEDTGLSVKIYCKKNIDKAYAHLYRAGYDAYDCISISFITEISAIMNKVSRTTLHTVIDNASTIILKPYNMAKELFTSAKVKKDVESRDQEEKQFKIYEQANGTLCDIRDLLYDHADDLYKHEQEIKNNFIKKITIQIIIFFLGCVFTILFSYFRK